jgi:hypothetical protein
LSQAAAEPTPPSGASGKKRRARTPSSSSIPSPAKRPRLTPREMAAQAAIARAQQGQSSGTPAPARARVTVPTPTTAARATARATLTTAAPPRALATSPRVCIVLDFMERNGNAQYNTMYERLVEHAKRDRGAWGLAADALGVERHKLVLGDFAWVAGHDDTELREMRVLPCVVERKTVADLVGRSFKADHVRQIRGLHRCSLQHPFFLIEGTLGMASAHTVYGAGPGDSGGGIRTEQDMFTLLAGLTLGPYRVKTLQTWDPEDTHRLLTSISALLARRLSDGVGQGQGQVTTFAAFQSEATSGMQLRRVEGELDHIVFGDGGEEEDDAQRAQDGRDAKMGEWETLPGGHALYVIQASDWLDLMMELHRGEAVTMNALEAAPRVVASLITVLQTPVAPSRGQSVLVLQALKTNLNTKITRATRSAVAGEGRDSLVLDELVNLIPLWVALLAMTEGWHVLLTQNAQSTALCLRALRQRARRFSSQQSPAPARSTVSLVGNSLSHGTRTPSSASSAQRALHSPPAASESRRGAPSTAAAAVHHSDVEHLTHESQDSLLDFDFFGANRTPAPATPPPPGDRGTPPAAVDDADVEDLTRESQDYFQDYVGGDKTPGAPTTLAPGGERGARSAAGDDVDMEDLTRESQDYFEDHLGSDTTPAPATPVPAEERGARTAADDDADVEDLTRESQDYLHDYSASDKTPAPATPPPREELSRRASDWPVVEDLTESQDMIEEEAVIDLAESQPMFDLAESQPIISGPSGHGYEREAAEAESVIEID